MSQYISYADPAKTRREQDDDARKDLIDWFTRDGKTEAMDRLYALAANAQEHAANGDHNAAISCIEDLNFFIGFGGVSGYPFHAFCRANCLTAYRLWMHDGDDAVMTDKEGFALKTEGDA